jgi:hypothetical protein
MSDFQVAPQALKTCTYIFEWSSFQWSDLSTSVNWNVVLTRRRSRGRPSLRAVTYNESVEYPSKFKTTLQQFHCKLQNLLYKADDSNLYLPSLKECKFTFLFFLLRVLAVLNGVALRSAASISAFAVAMSDRPSGSSGKRGDSFCQGVSEGSYH